MALHVKKQNFKNAEEKYASLFMSRREKQLLKPTVKEKKMNAESIYQ